MQLNPEKNLLLLLRVDSEVPTMFYDLITGQELIELDIGIGQSLLYTCPEVPHDKIEEDDYHEQKCIHSFIFSSCIR